MDGAGCWGFGLGWGYVCMYVSKRRMMRRSHLEGTRYVRYARAGGYGDEMG